MKTLNLELTNEMLKEFALSNEEMITVRGGTDEGEPRTLPTFPPIIL
jgi:hypothetical protein